MNKTNILKQFTKGNEDPQGLCQIYMQKSVLPKAQERVVLRNLKNTCVPIEEAKIYLVMVLLVLFCFLF